MTFFQCDWCGKQDRNHSNFKELRVNDVNNRDNPMKDEEICSACAQALEIFIHIKKSGGVPR